MLAEFIPPITKKIARKLIGAKHIYKNFEEANNAVRKFNGYDDPQLINIILNKSKQYIEILKNRNTKLMLDTHHLFLLTVISLLNKKGKIKVLDFGGAFGTHYFIAKSILNHIQFEWTVVELPEVIKLGKSLQNDELTFLDLEGDFNKQVGSFDLVLTSATLQHMPNPDKALSFLAKQGAPYLALLRLGLTPSDQDLWTIHKAHFSDCGPGKPLPDCPNKVAAFTFCMMSENKIDTLLDGYELQLSNHDMSGTIHVPGKKVTGYNRLYKR